MSQITTEEKNGWMAHKNGVSSDANPYDEKTQAVSRVLWEQGWFEREDEGEEPEYDISYLYELRDDDDDDDGDDDED